VADKARVIIAFETVMGRDKPVGLTKTYDGVYGTVTSLVMRMLQPWHHTGRRIWLDSGFCVLLLIAALSKVGLYANAQIKKRRYWPKFLPIEEIQTHLEAMEIGDWGVYEGKFLGNPIFITYLRDEKWNSLHMSGFCVPERDGKMHHRVSNTKHFQFPSNMANYLRCRPFVDHANAARHSADGMALEISYKTHRIIIREWTCDVAMSEGVYHSTSPVPLFAKKLISKRLTPKR